jgi:hypothetical protein
MTKPYVGGCLCGAVRYEIAGEPAMAGHCQCRDCQRMTGTGHASMMAFPADAVKVTGALTFHGTRADTGNTANRGFCPRCGSFVASRSSGMPGVIMVSAGSLDDPSRFQPQFVVYASRGHGWDRVDAALTQFPKMPPARP